MGKSKGVKSLKRFLFFFSILCFGFLFINWSREEHIPSVASLWYVIISHGLLVGFELVTL